MEKYGGSDSVKEIRFLPKNTEEAKRFGELGKDGVIIIKTKKYVEASKN